MFKRAHGSMPDARLSVWTSAAEASASASLDGDEDHDLSWQEARKCTPNIDTPQHERVAQNAPDQR